MIDGAAHPIDADEALAVWEDALAAPAHAGPDVWVQGDLEGNCLVDAAGRLCGILVDGNSACIGDPAVGVLAYYLDTHPLIVERSWHKLAALGIGPAVG